MNQLRGFPNADTRLLQTAVDFAQAADVDAGHSLRSIAYPLPGWMGARRPNVAGADAVAIKNEAFELLRGVVEGKKQTVELRIVQQVWRDAQVGPGVHLSTGSDSVRDLVLYRLLRLLERVGTDKLQACGECQRLFIKVTRKEFCSTRCQGRVNMRNWRSRNTAPATKRRAHGKKTRTR
jgi:endogenous inhibitor of DNA gyrase (YacG/DUF329 family)